MIVYTWYDREDVLPYMNAYTWYIDGMTGRTSSRTPEGRPSGMNAYTWYIDGMTGRTSSSTPEGRPSGMNALLSYECMLQSIDEEEECLHGCVVLVLVETSTEDRS